MKSRLITQALYLALLLGLFSTIDAQGDGLTSRSLADSYSTEAPASLQLPILSTFDTDSDGWTLGEGQIGSLQHWGLGGNPGGYIRFEDAFGASSAHIVAPAQYLGDWTSLEGVASLTWQHRVIEAGGVPTFQNLEAEISGPGGSARYISEAEGMVGAWVSVSAPIVEGAWNLVDGDWSALLFDITELRIKIEVVANGGEPLDIAGIDNVQLSGLDAVAIPQVEFFSTSLGGWTLESGDDGAVNYAPLGGNDHGHARFQDEFGATQGTLVAPASWRGSWTAGEMPLFLSWDHKIELIGGGPTILNLRAEIEGPGGVASFDSGIQASANEWITMVAPIEESSWSVNEGGRWEDILAWVTDVRIEIEGVANSQAPPDISLVDNIMLLSNELPETQPVLAIPERVEAVFGAPVLVPVNYSANAGSVSELFFSVDFDEVCLSLDPADQNGDGIPDAIVLQLPNDFEAFVSFSANDTNGELDFVILATTPESILTGGTLATVELNPVCEPLEIEILASVGFSSIEPAVFGSITGEAISGIVTGGFVEIVPSLFVDGFESGNVSAWSDSAP